MVTHNQDATDSATLRARWNALPVQSRRRAWARYTTAVDAGDSGWMPYAMLLGDAWCEGIDPTGGLFQDRAFGLIFAKRAAPA